jgi:hypothetical protein
MATIHPSQRVLARVLVPNATVINQNGHPHATSPSLVQILRQFGQHLLGITLVLLGIGLVLTLVLMPIGLPLALMGIALIAAPSDP